MSRKKYEPAPPILSTNAGFTAKQLPVMEAHRKTHNFSGIEFVKDTRFQENGFYQVKCSSPGEWQRYLKSRGIVDFSSLNGGGTLPDIEAARSAVLRQYGPPRRHAG
jgi:hypothetical protein